MRIFRVVKRLYDLVTAAATTAHVSHPQNCTAQSEPRRALRGSVGKNNASTLAHPLCQAQRTTRQVTKRGRCFPLNFSVNLKLLSELTNVCSFLKVRVCRSGKTSSN